MKTEKGVIPILSYSYCMHFTNDNEKELTTESYERAASSTPLKKYQMIFLVITITTNDDLELSVCIFLQRKHNLHFNIALV